jgi:hypothetical protein
MFVSLTSSTSFKWPILSGFDINFVRGIFAYPTPLQAYVFLSLLNRGDTVVCGCAKSGKTVGGIFFRFLCVQVAVVMGALSNMLDNDDCTPKKPIVGEGAHPHTLIVTTSNAKADAVHALAQYLRSKGDGSVRLAGRDASSAMAVQFLDEEVIG